MNLFRTTPDRSLDKQYLRVCAVYRLMKRRRLEKARAVSLLRDRKVPSAEALVELWLDTIAKQARHAA